MLSNLIYVSHIRLDASAGAMILRSSAPYPRATLALIQLMVGMAVTKDVSGH